MNGIIGDGNPFSSWPWKYTVLLCLLTVKHWCWLYLITRIFILLITMVDHRVVRTDDTIKFETVIDLYMLLRGLHNLTTDGILLISQHGRGHTFLAALHAFNAILLNFISLQPQRLVRRFPLYGGPPEEMGDRPGTWGFLNVLLTGFNFRL